MKPLKPGRRLHHLLTAFALGVTLAQAVPIPIIAEADLDVNENLDTQVPPVAQDAAGAFDATNLNARFSNLDRNEVFALRFNLAGQDRAQIASAAVRLVAFRANTSNQTLRIYGVNDEATGYNAVTLAEGAGTDDTWPESGTTFSTMPGLEFDADVTTRGIRSDRVTDLGTGVVSSSTAEGAEILISTTALKDFLVNHADNTVTILVVSDTVTGNQKRFASKEATLLETGVTPQPVGTYAPRLLISLPGIRVAANADVQVNEQNNSGNGTGTQINARYNPVAGVGTGNNEIIGLRFDLTGNNPLDIISAEVALVNHRANGAATLHYYGVVDGSTGYNEVTSTAGTTTDDDWPESGTVFATLPGLTYDASTTTAGIRTASVVNLGTLTTSSANGNLAEGTKVVFSNDNLISFLKTHPDNVVTIIVISDSTGTGQKRFGTRESTTLGSGGAAQPAGTYAPEINLLLANIDRDGDGLRNQFEETYGLNPDNPDSDGDTIPDGQDDLDSDFSNNLDEQTRGTIADNPDSDSDGLLDGYETKSGFWTSTVDTGTNPLVADTDGDGLFDGFENFSLAHTGPEQPGTDPNDRDTDDDLYSDGAEIARDTDPTLGNEVPDGAVLVLQGNNTAALLPGPLTDPEGNIDDSTAAGANFNWVAVTSTPAKNFFGTGTLGVDPQNMSGAYDLFDNKVGTLNNKWLTSGVSSVGGTHTTVEFAGTVSLTSFVIASADDRPERDPVDWQILGSNDGTTFTPIFTQFDPARLTIWSQRNQVIQGTLAAASPQYRFIRFACTKVGTGENQMHVNEVQYFGTLTPDPAAPEFRITGFTGGPGAGNISLTWLSQPGETYRIAYSTSLTDGFVGTAAANIAATAGGTTTHSFPNPLPAEPRLFFRVEKP